MSETTTPEVVNDTVASGEVTGQEIRELVGRDKEIGLEVIRAAKEQVSSFRMIVLVPDITGKPDGLAQFARYKGDQLRNLEHITRAPFFLRVTSDQTMPGETKRVLVLLTKAREVGGVVFGDGWILTTWTSPLGLAIRGRQPGERIELKREPAVAYDVHEWASYEELLPRFLSGEFRLRDGRAAAIVSEDDLEEMLASAVASAKLPVAEYETKPTFGLSDIIVLVDEPQRAALALPFRQSAIIEGPPGSGKTSIGIMRIAVLYDQQWDELGLQRDRDRPFHDYSTMRVLVYNDEMVEYLKGLANSIHVDHVQVSTTKDFLRRICRETRLLRGTERRDKHSLAVIKGRREALLAYFAGFKAHATRHWQDHENELRQKLFDLGPDFLTLADRIDDWIKRIDRAEVVDDRITNSIGIADILTDAANTIQKGTSPTRKARSPFGDAAPLGEGRPIQLKESVIQDRMADARKLVEGAIRGACSRDGITRTMFKLPEYDSLKESLRRDGVPPRTIDDGDRLWKRQYAGDLPAYSELDLAMSAWLGARLLLSAKNTKKPWIGGRLERLSHIVVDEAQDLSPSHIAVLSSQLVPNGTMTLVGDIHQNLNPHAGLQRWEDVHFADGVRSAFGVNHRQTRQLGEFLQGLHAELFREDCLWKPAEKMIGPLPRAGTARSWDELARAVAVEASYWRESITGPTGATVAVLYDGRLEPKRLLWLQKQLEAALADQLIPVEVALPLAGGESLRRTDRVIIASVRQTKGLEFDAVIFVEPQPRWSKDMEEIDLRVRNGFYVATSRARAGLSICMSNLPPCMDTLAEQGLCRMVDWTEASDKVM